MWTAVAITAALAVAVQGFLLFDNTPKQVCYGDLGCFSDAAPFRSAARAVSFLPQSPDQIKTTFNLYTRATPTTGDEEVIHATDLPGLDKSHFNNELPTKFIVHGFTHNGHRQWILNMVAELLKQEACNVIGVDWGNGAGLPYGQATANTRVVGAEIAYLINTLIANRSMTADQFHIIGHSLGAHVAGYAGERVKGLGRISGLDPANPYFEGTDPKVRLDPSDALFIDVIHSDASNILALGFGAKQAMGHVDFYPNGGHDQPGCDNNLLGKLTHSAWNLALIDQYAAEATIACSHERSYYYYIESINSACPLAAFPCASEADFKHGRCMSCLGNQCSRMGYHANKYSARGSLFLSTESAAPFCHYHYSVNITSDNPMDGIVSITLHGSNGDAAEVPLTTMNEVVTSGSVITHLVTTKKFLGDLTKATVSYEKTHNILTALLYSDNWQLMGMSVVSGETQKTSQFCAYGKTVANHAHVDFNTVGNC